MSLLVDFELSNNDFDGVNGAPPTIVCGYHVPCDMGLDLNGTGVTYRSYVDEADCLARGLNNPRGGFSCWFGGEQPTSLPVRSWADDMVIARKPGFDTATKV